MEPRSKVGSYRPEHTGFGPNDARFLKRHGFNTIRLGVIYKALEPDPPGADGRPRYDRATNDIGVVDEINDLADDHMMGWQQWHYCECDDPTTAGTGVQSVVKDPHKRPRGENLNRDKLVASARPYPQAIAGTPLDYGFDHDGRAFVLTYSTATPSGAKLPRRAATRVVLPRIQYPGGYRVVVNGAKVLSRRKARVLRLRRDRGAAEVSVVVTPAS